MEIKNLYKRVVLSVKKDDKLMNESNFHMEIGFHRRKIICYILKSNYMKKEIIAETIIFVIMRNRIALRERVR